MQLCLENYWQQPGGYLREYFHFLFLPKFAMNNSVVVFRFIIITSYTANLAAFLTVTRLDKPIESLDDLSNQFKVKYAPLNGSMTQVYFQRMYEVETRINNIWIDMSLNASLTPYEKAKFSVWADPVGDKYKKMWRVIQDTGMPTNIDEALIRIRKSTPDDGFALFRDGPEIRYLELKFCDLKTVGKDFGLRYRAILVQEGSSLKGKLDDA